MRGVFTRNTVSSGEKLGLLAKKNRPRTLEKFIVCPQGSVGFLRQPVFIFIIDSRFRSESIGLNEIKAAVQSIDPQIRLNDHLKGLCSAIYEVNDLAPIAMSRLNLVSKNFRCARAVAKSRHPVARGVASSPYAGVNFGSKSG